MVDGWWIRWVHFHIFGWCSCTCPPTSGLATSIRCCSCRSLKIQLSLLGNCSMIGLIISFSSWGRMWQWHTNPGHSRSWSAGTWKSCVFCSIVRLCPVDSVLKNLESLNIGSVLPSGVDHLGRWPSFWYRVFVDTAAVVGSFRKNISGDWREVIKYFHNSIFLLARCYLYELMVVYLKIFIIL